VDSLSALSAFVRAAEARNFTDAGRQLSVSASAVAKAISRLEGRLGVRLFHRSTRSVSLTQEGRLFLESSRRIFAEISTVELEFAQTKGTPKGRLRVSLPLVGMLIMPALGCLMRKYPDIELDIDFTDHLVDVINGGYDVVVRTGNVTDSRLMSRRLGGYRMEIVGSPAYFARAGKPTKPEDLATHACLHHRYPTSGKLQRWPLAKSADGSDIVLPSTAVLNTTEPLIALAELGAGLVCAPDFAIRRQIADGSLERVLGDHIEHQGSFRAIWPSSKHPSPKLRVFVDFMAKHLFPNSQNSRGAATEATTALLPVI
jgi:DNA-binding transcriptional LysR family regulator